ncbi:MAG: helix-turn-helix transcriptional regulator [Cohaesibacteraceae bacterium]|nr:helix-turn-helix transcriptional regulator [Cohaesibacteraceae bacterium]
MRELDQSNVYALIDGIYGAALSGQWQHTIEQLARVSGDTKIYMYGYDIQIDHFQIMNFQNFDPDFVSSFVQHYSGINPWAEKISNTRTGEVGSSRLHVPDDQLIGTEYHNDWMLPQENCMGGGALTLFNDNDRMMVLGANIRMKDRVRHEDSWLDLLRILTPHLTRAFRMQRALGGINLERQGYGEAIERTGNAAFLIDGSGNICHHNLAARSLLDNKDLIYLDQYRSVAAFDPVANKTIQHSLKAIASGSPEKIGDVFAIHKRDRFEASYGLVLPLTGRGGQVSNVVSLRDIQDPSRGAKPVAILMIVDPARKRNPVAHILTGLYQLTPAEAALASSLSQGLSLLQYSETHSISLHTVRNQLKIIFDKTGVRKQSELVALIARIPG